MRRLLLLLLLPTSMWSFHRNSHLIRWRSGTYTTQSRFPWTVIAASEGNEWTRRTALQTLLLSLIVSPRDDDTAYGDNNDHAILPTLRQRVEGGVVTPSPYMLETSDVFYPEWFNGVWSTESTTLSIEAPAGIALFGGNRSFQLALDDINRTISYETRFRLVRTPTAAPTGTVVADREFNIASIIRATMGKSAVLDVPSGQNDDPNRIVFVLSPTGANGTIFRAELRASGRHVEESMLPSSAMDTNATPDTEQSAFITAKENIGASKTRSMATTNNEKRFDVLETVRQVVAADRSTTTGISTSSPPLVKDIETTTLYTKIGDNRIEALQRTASFLVASTNSDPLKAAAIQRMGGRAVDVRTYKVVYTLKRRLASSTTTATATSDVS